MGRRAPPRSLSTGVVVAAFGPGSAAASARDGGEEGRATDATVSVPDAIIPAARQAPANQKPQDLMLATLAAPRSIHVFSNSRDAS